MYVFIYINVIYTYMQLDCKIRSSVAGFRCFLRNHFVSELEAVGVRLAVEEDPHDIPFGYVVRHGSRRDFPEHRRFAEQFISAEVDAEVTRLVHFKPIQYEFDPLAWILRLF